MKNKKSLGQHWLYNRAILDEIARLLANDDERNAGVEAVNKLGLCLEIGPGLGTLTASLFRYFSRIMAVEFDERLANNLPKSFPGKDLEVINQDILKFDFSRINEEFYVAGNIPYYITSPIIEKLLLAEKKPKRIVLLMQKEVAERILSEKETVLSLFVKNRAQVFPGPIVLKNEFTPPPKVDSMVVVFEPKARSEISDEVFNLIKKAFSAPRKKIIANLAGLKSREELKRILEELKISVDARPADLHLEEWAKLYERLQ